MADTKTKPTRVNVNTFIASVENEPRRADAKILVKVFQKATGWKPQMLGPSIIGFGLYHYKYETGHSGASCVVGFSPRKSHLVIYAFDFAGKADLLNRLGKHKGGLQQCLYINKLADVDLDVLTAIIKGGVEQARSLWPVTPR